MIGSDQSRKRARLFGAGILLALVASGIRAEETGRRHSQRSAAMKRFKVDDSLNELYTLFRYAPIKGLGYEEGVGRRDPSTIIKVGGLYYVWYTRISGHPPVGVKNATETKRAFRWRYHHYGRIRDVLVDPKRFGLPEPK